MELEKQVCSLNLSGRLKELGVKQDSAFYWTNDGLLVFRDTEDISLYGVVGNAGSVVKKIECSAFTVAELGEMLPIELKRQKMGSETHCYLLDTRSTYGEQPRWYIRYLHSLTREPLGNELFIEAESGTEADARAKMLIYLLENNLIVPPKAELT